MITKGDTLDNLKIIAARLEDAAEDLDSFVGNGAEKARSLVLSAMNQVEEAHSLFKDWKEEEG